MMSCAPLGILRKLALLIGVVCTILPTLSHAFDTQARSAFVLDFETGTVLLEKNADKQLPPASMSKLMTVYMAFDALREGRLTLDEKLPVSEHAMSYGGSTMFLDTTDRVSVEDLLHGIIVLSGNDASAVIAEALSPDGTEIGFARLMTARAKQLGMMNSNFVNSNGWPKAGHVMSARDLGLLAKHIIEEFPEYYGIFAKTEFLFDGRATQNIHNRNPLLRLGVGADGLKTGHTNQAGYGLVGSAIRDGRRVIVVLTGLESETARAKEAERLINWSFRNFSKIMIAQKGQKFGQASTWMGENPFVTLESPDAYHMLRALEHTGPMTATIEYEGPITAPIIKGTVLAQLVLRPEGLAQQSFDLVAGEDVPEGGVLVRLITVVKKLMIDFDILPKEAM